jgi:hypothetical protein
MKDAYQSDDVMTWGTAQERDEACIVKEIASDFCSRCIDPISQGESW